MTKKFKRGARVKIAPEMYERMYPHLKDPDLGGFLTLDLIGVIRWGNYIDGYGVKFESTETHWVRGKGEVPNRVQYLRFDAKDLVKAD